MTYGKCPFHGMEIGNGNWTGIRNCFPMHLISQMTACLSGITDWAELSLTKHDVPALGDLGKNQKYPLPKRKALFYCHGGRAWNLVLESEKGEIEIIFKKLKGKKKKKNNLSKEILYYHRTWANCTRRLCKQTALPDSCENFTLNRQPTSALITSSSATPGKICSKSAS